MKNKLGIVFRNNDGKLMLMRPREEIAREISDSENLYTELADSQAEIVDVVDTEGGNFALRSHFCQTFFESDKQTPAKAHQVIRYIMEGAERREEWVSFLESEINKPEQESQS